MCHFQIVNTSILEKLSTSFNLMFTGVYLAILLKCISVYNFNFLYYIFQLAETLLKNETLNYDDVVKLIGPPPHGKKRLIEPMEFEASVNQASSEGSSSQNIT